MLELFCSIDQKLTYRLLSEACCREVKQSPLWPEQVPCKQDKDFIVMVTWIGYSFVF